MKKSILYWLYLGLFMVLIQIVLGGITRLTGSGLSITEWDVIQGTIPPMNEAQWNDAFDLYKATPQYEKLNEGMTMRSFKFIYFWEYIHRLWARTMGLVFAIPFVIFYRKGWIKGRFMRQLITMVVLAAVVASFGWIMVKSGLVDRPWVDAYKLTIHLGLGTALFLYIGFVTFNYHRLMIGHSAGRRIRWIRTLFIITCVQLLLGGLMSGMKAGLFYPTWPAIDGSWIPGVILQGDQWSLTHLTDYDTNAFAPALIQFLHRMGAYVVYILGLVILIKQISAGMKLLKAQWVFLLVLHIQVVLGIVTLINCVGSVPVTLGVLHQAGGILLLLSILWLDMQQKAAIELKV